MYGESFFQRKYQKVQRVKVRNSGNKNIALGVGHKGEINSLFVFFGINIKLGL